MPRIVVPVPESLNLNSALEFSSTLSGIPEGDEYMFDFSKTRNVEPFPMLLVSSQIQRLAKKYETSKIACTNYKHMTYAGHMGFFQAFGLEFGKFPGEARGSDHYLPLTSSVPTLIEEDQLVGAIWQNG